MNSKKKQPVTVLLFAGMVLIGVVGLSSCKKEPEPAPPLESAAQAVAAAIEQTTCPIMGGPINKDATGHIGDLVKCGDFIGHTDEHEIRAAIDGKIRGLIRSGIHVTKGLKIGDIDPRGAAVSCETISDKSLAVARAVLEAILRVYNR